MLRTTLPPASLSHAIEGVVREADRSVPVVRLRDMDGVFAESIVAVVATITLVAAVACWIPAWRASRLDPNVVLRDD